MTGALIVDYRTPDDTLRCIESLPADLPVVVVDNYGHAEPGGERTWAAIEQRAQVVRSGRNLGLSGALNVGFALLSGDVLVLNPDVHFLQPGEVGELQRVLDANPDAGLVGPRLVYESGEDQPSARTFPTFAALMARRTPFGRTRWGRQICDRHLHSAQTGEDLVPADWVLGAAMLIRREALDGIGGFDDGFFLYNEEIDFCARLWRAGWRVLQARTVMAVHGYRRDSDRAGSLLAPAVRWHFASMIRLAAKYPAPTFFGASIRKAGCPPEPHFEKGSSDRRVSKLPSAPPEEN